MLRYQSAVVRYIVDAINLNLPKSLLTSVSSIMQWCVTCMLRNCNMKVLWLRSLIKAELVSPYNMYDLWVYI